MAKRYVYVENFGGWWRLTVEEWRELCVKGASAAEEGYDLRRFKEIGRPRWAKRSHGRVKESWWLDHPVHLFYQPLDWEPEDYRAALATLDDLDSERSTRAAVGIGDQKPN